MNLLRPRNLVLAFAAYFGVVCYYAWQAARRTNSVQYGPGISISVYQTTMVGSVLVLIGMFITASISPHIRSASPSRSSSSLGALKVIRRSRGDSGRTPGDSRARADSTWPEGDEFLEEP